MMAKSRFEFASDTEVSLVPDSMACVIFPNDILETNNFQVLRSYTSGGLVHVFLVHEFLH